MVGSHDRSLISRGVTRSVKLEVRLKFDSVCVGGGGLSSNEESHVY